MTAYSTPSASKAWLAALTALVALLAVALALPAAAPAAPAAKRLVKPSALPAFPSCASLLGYARRNARRTGGRTGVPTRAGVLDVQVLTRPVQTDVVQAPGAPAPQAAEGKSVTADAPSFSQTNVQEAGVDEPDIVKTDGRTVFAIADGRLHAIDVTGARRRSSARSTSTAPTAISC